MRIVTNEFQIVEIEVEEDVDVGSRIKDYKLPELCATGGIRLLFNVV